MPTPIATRLSSRVHVYPPGAPPPNLPDGAIGLPQRAGAAFGDGSHPTTRLCAGAVDLLMRQHRPRSVLDVGTGTGILARIARARGAAVVTATDIDPRALAAARSNAGLDAHPVEIAICASAPDTWGPRFELVVAKILEATLCALAPALAGALTPGGTLLLSGFTPMQVPALRAAFAGPGLTYVTASALEGWSLLMLRRASATGEG